GEIAIEKNTGQDHWSQLSHHHRIGLRSSGASPDTPGPRRASGEAPCWHCATPDRLCPTAPPSTPPALARPPNAEARHRSLPVVECVLRGGVRAVAVRRPADPAPGHRRERLCRDGG